VDAYEPFLSLGLALAAGILIGLEREQSAPAERVAESFLGGARTHPLVALSGALSVLLSRRLGVAVVVAAFAALAVLLVVNYADDVRQGKERGITSEMAFVVSFLLGGVALAPEVLPGAGPRVVVVLGTAVVAAALLSSKPVLQPLMRRVSREDVASTLKFLVVAVVVVPLLPDRSLGPFGALNPRVIGWMLLLVTGVSFVGYAATRLLGPERGLGLTGLVGGLVSSTAVTLAMAARAKEEPRLARPAALAVVLASSIVFLRVLVLVALVNPALARTLAFPMLGMAVAGLAASVAVYRRGAGSATPADVLLRNPVSLSSAMQFSLLFAVVLVASKAANAWLGSTGVYVAALAAGTTDMDAIALSMAELARGALPTTVAATAVFLAAATNTIVKGAMAVALGGGTFARLVTASLAAILAAGGASLLVVWR
jgi:uncharacterized membrane protein (DUF4010 family)